VPSGAQSNVLRGKVALVTGGSRGIGLAIAAALAEQGCRIALASRHQSDLEHVRHRLPRKTAETLARQCDVRDPISVEELLSAIEGRFHHLDILVNNAGTAHPNLPVSKLPLEVWQEVVETNLTGMFLVTRAALPLMRSGSAVVNNLSIAAKRIFPGSSAYNASKHGALGFTNTLREELREKGIRVIALLAGATNTAAWDALWPEAPRKKMMAPETVAKALVNALTLPLEATVEELTILPRAGTL